MAEHIRLRGDRVKAAQWLPFARKQMRQLRAAGQRFRTLEPRADVWIRLLANAREDHIWIRVEGLMNFVAFGGEGNVAYFRLGRSIASFPRRTELYRNFDVVTGDPEDVFNLAKLHSYSENMAWAFRPSNEISDTDMYLHGVRRDGKQIISYIIENGYGAHGNQPNLEYLKWIGTGIVFPMGRNELGLKHLVGSDSRGDYILYFAYTPDRGETLLGSELAPVVGHDYSEEHVHVVEALQSDFVMGVKGCEFDIEVTQSIDKGGSWASNPIAWTTLTAGLPITGGMADEAAVAFAANAVFHLMQGRVLLVSYVLTNNVVGEKWGVMRCFVSEDGGWTFVARAVLPVNPTGDPGRVDLFEQQQVVRPPVVLPDNRVLYLRQDGQVFLSDSEVNGFAQAAPFPVSDTARIGCPSAVTLDGAFRVVVTAAVDDPDTEEVRFVVYANRDDEFTGWVEVGEIERRAEMPYPDAPALFPFPNVIRLEDPPNPAFPGAFEEGE